MKSAHARRATLPSLRLATLLVAFAALTSCSDSTGTGSNVSSVTKMHLVFSGGVAPLDVTSNKGEPRTVHIPVNTPVTVTATFLRADGTADPTVTATAFRLKGDITVFGGSPVMTYTASTTDDFSGTVLAPIATTTVGGGAVGFQLTNKATGRSEFGPWSVFFIAP